MSNKVKHGQYIVGYHFMSKDARQQGFGSIDITVTKSSSSFDEFKETTINLIKKSLNEDYPDTDWQVVILSVSRVAY